MPVIITATDFSDVAGNAVNYACRLAVQQQARLVVLHAFLLPVMFSDVPMPGSLVTDARQDAETQMGNLLSELEASYPGLGVSGKVIYGDTIDVLEDFKENEAGPWLVVIGNSSLAEHNSWPDSILVDALQTLQYPVLAVPPGAAFHPVRKLCFAMDNKPGYAAFADKLKNIVAVLGAELHLLHVEADAAQTAPDEQVKTTFAGMNPAYHFMNGVTNVDDAILAFAESGQMDWLVLMPRRHSFFNALMHKSHTRAIANESHLPILAIHES